MVRIIYTCVGQSCFFLSDKRSRLSKPFDSDFDIQGFVRYNRSEALWEAVVWADGEWILAGKKCILSHPEVFESEIYSLLIKSS